MCFYLTFNKGKFELFRTLLIFFILLLLILGFSQSLSFCLDKKHLSYFKQLSPLVGLLCFLFMLGHLTCMLGVLVAGCFCLHADMDEKELSIVLEFAANGNKIKLNCNRHCNIWESNGSHIS